jgi:hypothetical protein
LWSYRFPRGYPTDDVVAIVHGLQKYNISRWGFVIFRCTYGSQDKWDRFLAQLQRHAQDRIQYEPGATDSLYSNMEWTVIEDAATLDGVDILHTSRRFREWVTEGPGVREMEGSKFTAQWHYSPRYSYFLHVDEETLESVVDEEKAGQPGGYFCRVVKPNNVLLQEELREKGEAVCMEWEEDPDEEDVERDLEDQRKRIKANELVELYGLLQDDIDRWYYMGSAENGIVPL